MRFIGLFLLVCLFTVTVLPQQDGDGNDSDGEDAVETVVTDVEALEKALGVEDAALRIQALKSFVEEYPESGLRTRAFESLSSARAVLADTKLRNNEPEAGITLFKLAVSEAPDPVSDDLFSKILVNIPTNLFLLGQRNAAFDVAEMLEVRSETNQRQLLRLATFYIGIKYATGARRIASKAIVLDPDDPLAYQTMGVAQRLGFDLQGAEESYSKALELSPDSLSVRQNLGEVKRALGKSSEAEALFDQILQKEADDIPARTGLILSLFDQNKRVEAEALLVKELNENPTNVFVMIGAANWYAANGEPEKAVEHTKHAVSIEESSVWAYIIMARGYMKLNQPHDAERSLLAATRFAATPTISYELALARASAGFYREAVDQLKTQFRVENGKIVTELDGRIGAEADSFSDLVGLERKSTLFSAAGAYDDASDAKLKKLLLFELSMTREETEDEMIAAAADAFIEGEDEMKTFRQIYASERLLDGGKLFEKAGELASSAVNGVEKSVGAGNSAGAVLAEQLYESRRDAAKTGRLVIIPDIEKSTLSKIMRGRIEDLAARSYLAREEYDAAALRFRRATSVLPKDSAWWRASMWNLGSVYQKQGDDKKALESYAASYSVDEPDTDKRAAIEAIYQRVNGSLDGLDDYLANKDPAASDPSSMFVKTTAATSETSTEPTDGAVPNDKSPVEEGGKAPEDVDATPRGSTPDLAPSPDAPVLRPVPAGNPPAKRLPEDLDLTAATQVPDQPASIDTAVPSSTLVSDTSSSDPEVKVPVQTPEITPPAAKPDTTKPEVKVDEDLNKAVPTVADPRAVDADTIPPAAKPDTTKPEVKVDEDLNKAVPTVADPRAVDADATPPAANPDTAKPEIKADEDLNKTEAPPTDLTDGRKSDDTEVTLEAPIEAPINPGVSMPATGLGRTDAKKAAADAEMIDLGATRPRVVPVDRIKPAPADGNLNTCQVVSSQETVSLIANGGSFGIVVGVTNYTDAYVLRAKSLSPEDISIVYEPEIGSVDGRAFFVVRSISEKTGEFGVMFETPCGAKIIGISVR